MTRPYPRPAVAVVVVMCLGASAAASCSNNPPTCGAPTSGTFQLSLKYTQTIPIDLFCDAGAIDASSCADRPHPFDGASWKVAASGASATVTAGGATWTCASIAPRAAPSTAPDGSSTPATGCYMLLECGTQSEGDAGLAQVQIQLLAPSSSDLLVLVHDVGSDCCTDEYTGSFR